MEQLHRAELRDAYYADEWGNPKLDEGMRAVYNLGLNTRAKYVSKGYNVVQHPDFEFGVETALVNLGITDYQKRIQQQGHKMFVDISLPGSVIKLEKVGEEFASGLRLINSYDTSTGVMIVTRLTRLACSNGMVIKKDGIGFSFRHNANIVAELQGQIEKALRNIINSYPNLQKMVENCIEDSVEWACVEKIMQGVIGRKKHIDNIRRRLPEGKLITRWELYNAITEEATHGEQLKPNVEAWLQSKAEKVLMTHSSELPQIEVEVD